MLTFGAFSEGLKKKSMYLRKSYVIINSVLNLWSVWYNGLGL